jgi:ankyrin repeat protein
MNMAWAVQSGDAAKVRDLLALGVDPNVAEPSGGSLLSYAAHWGRTEIIGLLLGAGARLDAADRRGWTPLMAAAARAPSEQPPPPDDNAAAVRRLVARGADLDARSTLGGPR